MGRATTVPFWESSKALTAVISVTLMEDFCIARERLPRKLFPTLSAAGCRVARRTIRSRLKREGVGRQQVRRRLPVPQPADEQQGSLLQSKPDDPEFQVLPAPPTTDEDDDRRRREGGGEGEYRAVHPEIRGFVQVFAAATAAATQERAEE